MMIDSCKPEIFKWPGAERLDQTRVRAAGVDLGTSDLFEKSLELDCIHAMRALVR